MASYPYELVVSAADRLRRAGVATTPENAERGAIHCVVISLSFLTRKHGLTANETSDRAKDNAEETAQEAKGLWGGLNNHNMLGSEGRQWS